MKYCKLITGFILFSILLSACSKEYSSEEIVNQKGNWEFYGSQTVYSGPLDTVFIKGNKMQVLGRTADQTLSFSITITSPTGVFLAGNAYNASAQQAEMIYSQNSNPVFVANAVNGEFTVNINLISEKFVSGTFSGIALDATGKKQQISQGKFSSGYGTDKVLLPN